MENLVNRKNGYSRLCSPVVAVLILLGSALGSGQSAIADERLNVLHISIDDLNDWIGCLEGHPQVKTPHMDRLAERGVLFRNAHCAVPVCSGSRVANWTGLSPIRTGVLSNGQKLGKALPDAVFLTQDLQAQGYRTLGTGKMLHSEGESRSMVDEYGPGFDKWMPILPDERTIADAELKANEPYVKHAIPRLNITMPMNEMPRDRDRGSDHIDSFDWGPIDRPDGEWTDTLCADWAVEKLGEAHDKPFFLGVGFYRPHQPLWAPKRYHDMYPPESVVLPEAPADDLEDVSKIAQDFGRLALTSGAHETVVKYGQWRKAVSAYLACISYVDAQIGRVLEALDASPYADNTMIVLWSDHGWQLGEKEHWGKFTAWERSTRVPLIISPPKAHSLEGFQAGSEVDRPVSLLDVYPTIVDMLGLGERPRLDGRSLLPLIDDPEADWAHPALSWVGHGTCTVRSERWRYTRYFDGSQELYDLKADPNEWNNLAGKSRYAKVVKRLDAEIPVDENYKHFARYGDYKALVPADGSRLRLYGPGVAMISEKKEVARAHPEIVEKVERYLKENPGAPQRLIVPSF